jgi:uncharacterized delta-60 repeat protein
MTKLWLSTMALLCVFVAAAQSYIRDNLFNLNLPTSTINVRDLVVYKDKRILIGGEFHAYSSSFSYNRVLRLTAGGTPDPTFTCPVVSGGRVNCIALQPWDSAIIIAGSFTQVNGVSRSGIARLSPSGALDLTFSPGTGISGSYAGDLIIWAVGVRTDADASKRRIIAGGQFNYYNGVSVANGNGGGLVQIKTDGSLDATALPKVEGGPVYALTVDDNGKILAGGEFYKVNGADCWRFVRINTDGTTDVTLWTGRWDGFNSSVGNVQAHDGMIYVGGFFTQYRGNNAGRLVRLKSDGSYDATFNTGTGFTGSTTATCSQGIESKSLAFMSNGKVVVGGNFTAYQGNTVYRIARLNSDGSYDASCVTGTGFDQCIERVVFQGTDDSLLAAGFFTSFRDEAQGSIIRVRKPPAAFTLALGAPQLEAVRLGERVQVRWQVETGAEGRTMELLRSEDGRRFSSILQRRTLDGVTAYNYEDRIDQKPLWYRVQLTDAAGRTATSPIVEVRSAEQAPGFFPNPCRDRINARLAGGYSGPVTLTWSSAPGGTVRSESLLARDGLVEIRSMDLVPGMYFVVIRDAGGRLLQAGPVVRWAH